MTSVRNAFALSLLVLLGACATTSSTGPAAGAPPLRHLVVAFDPGFLPDPEAMKGQTDIAWWDAPRVDNFSAVFATKLTAGLPSKLASIGIAVVNPAPGVPVLHGRVQSFKYWCPSGRTVVSTNRLDPPPGTEVLVPMTPPPPLLRHPYRRLVCQTGVQVVMDLSDAGGNKVWSFQSFIVLEDVDQYTPAEFEEQLVAAMSKDGLLHAAQAPSPLARRLVALPAAPSA